MSKQKKVDPFEHTLIIPGVPELPEESTLILKEAPNPPEAVKQQEGTSPEPAEARRERARWKPLTLWAASLVVLTTGMTWWFLTTGHPPLPIPHPASSSPASQKAALPPALQGYLEAAEKGDPKAMRMLGACYTYGLGVKADREEGVAWYRKAAKAGDPTAAKELKLVGAD